METPRHELHPLLLAAPALLCKDASLVTLAHTSVVTAWACVQGALISHGAVLEALHGYCQWQTMSGLYITHTDVHLCAP